MLSARENRTQLAKLPDRLSIAANGASFSFFDAGDDDDDYDDDAAQPGWGN